MSIKTITKSLVDEFQCRPTLRAGSLVTTVFGDAIAPRGGTVWLGSLIKVMSGFGISERLVRTSVFRLVRDGWLAANRVGRRSFYSLTEEGAQKFEQATHRIYGEPRLDWSGEWTFVLLSGLDSTQRETARKELSWLGFGATSTSLMAHPAADLNDLKALLLRLRVHDEVVVMNGHALDDSQNDAMRDLVRKSWNLEQIDERYEQFLRYFEPVRKAVCRDGKLSPQNAFQIRTLLIQEYRKILLRDPLLPSEMLADDWHGFLAYQLCRDLYQGVFHVADQFLTETMETADGPLPPPTPEFFKRFGGLK
jgi:phenylacetic acid degradation operon negative regulatory protein